MTGGGVAVVVECVEPSVAGVMTSVACICETDDSVVGIHGCVIGMVSTSTLVKVGSLAAPSHCNHLKMIAGMMYVQGPFFCHHSQSE